jgi:thiamine monophosphate synthase
VAVDAPGYGYHHAARSMKVHKAGKIHKDQARIAATGGEATPAKTPEAAPSDAAAE